MESELSEENPTTGDSGASIEARLEKYLSAGEPQAAKPEPASQEPVQAAETQSEKPKEGVPTVETQPQISTADLAKVFGLDESTIDVDEDGSPVIKAKIDGKEVPAKLADLLKDYQIRGHAENKAREAAEAHKAAQARMQEVEQVFQARMQQAETLTAIAQQELSREYQSVDWNTLQAHDPGRAALLKQEFQERSARLQGVLQNVQHQRAAQMQQVNLQAEHAKAQRLNAEAEKLPSLIPEWKDASVKDKESREMLEWGRKAGYSQETLQRLNESTALDIATFRKAMLFDKLQQSKPEIENKVRQAPKIVKPGQLVQNSQGEALRDLKQQVVKSGGKQGSLEAYLLKAGKV